MRTWLIALVSFALGAATVLLSEAPSNKVFAQFRPLSSGNESRIPTVPTFGVAVPKVLPIEAAFANNVIDFSDSDTPLIDLDGMSMRNGTFSGGKGQWVVIKYGGGAYELDNTTISGPIRLELTGAAANTAKLMESFGLLAPTQASATKVPQVAAEKNQPITKKTVLVKPLKGDIFSQYDGRKP
jgi:hypothetical protein